MSRYVNRRSIAIVLVLLLGSGGAYAYWTHAGGGSGSAVTGSASGIITVVQTSTVTGLYPNGTPVALSGNFNNANTYNIHVNAVYAAIDSVTGPNIDGGHPCAAIDYSLAGFPANVNADVIPGTGKGSWGAGGTSTIQMVERPVNQDGCMGATVALTYTSD
jgi:hypothetical protein